MLFSSVLYTRYLPLFLTYNFKLFLSVEIMMYYEVNYLYIPVFLDRPSGWVFCGYPYYYCLSFMGSKSGGSGRYTWRLGAILKTGWIPE